MRKGWKSLLNILLKETRKGDAKLCAKSNSELFSDNFT